MANIETNIDAAVEFSDEVDNLYQDIEQHPSIRSFLEIIAQAEELLDYEIESLQSQKLPDFTAINTKKIRVLRDLEEAKEVLLNISDRRYQEYAIEKLAGLKPKLERDQELLKMHLDAVSDLVEVIKSSVKNAEADGTYSVPSIVRLNKAKVGNEEIVEHSEESVTK